MAARRSIAYLITSHKHPEQVLRLVSTLRRGAPASPIVIHHNDVSCQLDATALAALDASLIEPPSRVEWGTASHLAMLLRCMSWLLARESFDWMVLLSGQDYPIRPVAEIEERLAGADVDAFIEAHPCPPPGPQREVDEFAMRYHFRWWRVPPRVASQSLARAAARTGLVRVRTFSRNGSWLGLRSLRTPFSSSFMCHFGPDWFTLSRAAVQTVLTYCEQHPSLLAYYRHTLLPSESFIQTVLANDAALRISGDYRRFIAWEPHTTSPRILCVDDLDAATQSGADFARKFDETVDRTVLDVIDRQVHGF